MIIVKNADDSKYKIMRDHFDEDFKAVNADTAEDETKIKKNKKRKWNDDEYLFQIDKMFPMENIASPIIPEELDADDM